jgi:hypothetical protein
LLYHANEKLLFPLCASCANSSQETCNHSEAERCLEGTWVSLEINFAIDNGYKIERIYEIWHWSVVEQYNPSIKTGGLFTAYSILLNKNNIKPNSGLKALSKLLLNSQWGRYAMQTLKTSCKFITSFQELLENFNNKQLEVKNLLFPSDHVALLLYKDNKEMHWGSNQTNVAIATYVTAQARLKLNGEMKLLGDRVMYVDTDSIFFKRFAGKYSPKSGDYLGEFTNEFAPSEGSHIVVCVSTKPKNHADKIKNIVCNMREERVYVRHSTLVRNKIDCSLRTKTSDKINRMVYDKRIICDDSSTLPNGF